MQFWEPKNAVKLCCVDFFWISTVSEWLLTKLIHKADNQNGVATTWGLTKVLVVFYKKTTLIFQSILQK